MTEIKKEVQSCITYLPVLVMIISVSRSWNLSQRSFVSNTHSTCFNSSQLHLDLVRILSSLYIFSFFFITWVVFGRLGVDSLSVDGECCKLVLDEMWWPFWDVCLKVSLSLKLSLPSSLCRSISISSWSLCFLNRWSPD
jgi:hypothetical protein